MLLSLLFFSFLLCAPALPTSHPLLNWASQSSFGRPWPPPDAPKPPANIHSDATSFSSSEHSYFNFFFFFFFFGTNSTLLYLLQFHSLQRFSLSSSPAQLRPCLSCRLASLSLSFVFFSFLPACLPAACWTCTATVVFGYHQQSAAGCFFASLLFFACLLVNFPLILWVIHFVSCFLFQNIFLLHCFGAPVPRLSLLACFTILTCAKHP